MEGKSFPTATTPVLTCSGLNEGGPELSPFHASLPDMKPPFPNSYWLEPGHILCGEYPRDFDDLSKCFAAFCRQESRTLSAPLSTT